MLPTAAVPVPVPQCAGFDTPRGPCPDLKRLQSQLAAQPRGSDAWHYAMAALVSHGLWHDGWSSVY